MSSCCWCVPINEKAHEVKTFMFLLNFWQVGEIDCMWNGVEDIPTTDMTKSNGGTPANGIDVGGNDLEALVKSLPE